MRNSPRRVICPLLLLAALAFSIENSAAGADGVAARGETAKAVAAANIAGTVVDGAGAPVAGGKVTLYRYASSKSKRWGRFIVLGETATTDQTGTYRFAGLTNDYFMVSVEKEGFARTFRDARIEDQGSQHVDVVLKPPASSVILIQDQAGKPVAGARVRAFSQRGVNGESRFLQLWLDSLGIKIPPSDAAGRLQLPPLPAGDGVRITIDHPRLAPIRTEELTVAQGATFRATMQPGVVVTLHAPDDQSPNRIASAVVDLRHEQFRDPSTILHYETPFDSQGKARLTVAPGNFSWFLLDHDDFYITPVYSANYTKKTWLRIEPGRNQNLHFDVRRKVPARGRVVEAETGKPLPEMSVMGELANGAPAGWDDAPPDKWSFAGWGETDHEGRYSIDLAAGSARVSFQGNELLPEHDYYEVSVAADGSTIIPDIKVRPMPKIIGIVQNPDGSPAIRAVVRLRGKYQSALQPVLTDAAGRFEIRPKWILIDEETGQRAYAQHVLAFDPHSPLAAIAKIRLDKPDEVALKLEPHAADWPLTEFSADFSDWERGVVEPVEAARLAAISLQGKTPPELDGALWLNTDGQPLTLAALRGKYVLLDFWFTGCGPCHADFPSMKMVHELFRERGVVVIGVHNSSGIPDAVRAHVAKIGLPFPVVLDHPDGRTVARFEPHGIPEGYPDYVLISPEGKVLFDDRTIPSPTLRGYKLEIIRKLLLESPGSAK